jgi:hypothetical protein
MFQKSRVLVVAAMAAGAIGLWASAASAGTGSASGPSGDNGGLANLSHNQVPVTGCGNEIPVNVLGVQVPIDRVAAALGLLSTEPAGAAQDSSCKQGAAQNNTTASATVTKTVTAKKQMSARVYHMSGKGWNWSYKGAAGDNGSLVNVSHNQVPLQLCNNRVPVNVLGVQVPADQIAGALGILSPGSVMGAQDSSCKQASGQNN